VRARHAAPEPYLGPATGDVLDARELAELERMVLRRATGAVTEEIPLVTGRG
jgi:hypothetical protein